MSELIRVKGLVVDYTTAHQSIRALDSVDMTIVDGVSLGLVGESGSGKTTLGMALGRLLPINAKLVSGQLFVAGQSVFNLDEQGIDSLRQDNLGFVFQSPMASLNPTMRVSKQIELSLGGNVSTGDVGELLSRVGLKDTKRIGRSYPHELSGGMAQRVVIAMAIARNPRLLVADEPTVSLDVSIRDQILDLLVSLREEADMTTVLLSHELGIVSRYCDVIGVMYSGRIVEFGPTGEVFNNPVHPYTRGLLEAAPGRERQKDRLRSIPGMPPLLRSASNSCTFAPRCEWGKNICSEERPELVQFNNRMVVCHRWKEFTKEQICDS